MARDPWKVAIGQHQFDFVLSGFSRFPDPIKLHQDMIVGPPSLQPSTTCTLFVFTSKCSKIGTESNPTRPPRDSIPGSHVSGWTQGLLESVQILCSIVQSFSIRADDKEAEQENMLHMAPSWKRTLLMSAIVFVSHFCFTQNWEIYTEWSSHFTFRMTSYSAIMSCS